VANFRQCALCDLPPGGVISRERFFRRLWEEC
jgi:hypothetical protein